MTGPLMIMLGTGVFIFLIFAAYITAVSRSMPLDPGGFKWSRGNGVRPTQPERFECVSSEDAP